MKDANHPEKLNWTLLGLIQRLLQAIMADVDRTFTSYSLDYLPGQREVIQQIVTAILNYVEGKVVAIPLVPGGGKSTVLRSILRVLSKFIAEGVEGILDYIGGVVVVVQTIAEMHALEAVCQEAAPDYPICRVIEGLNEAKLKNSCVAGIATCFDECLREDCEKYDECSLMTPHQDSHSTPILIISHVRYDWFIDSPNPLLTWTSLDGIVFQRRMVLVDEAPQLTDIQPLDASFMYVLSGKICNPKNIRHPDYSGYKWRRYALDCYFSLQRVIFRSKPYDADFGEVTAEMLDEAELNSDQLYSTRCILEENGKNQLVLREAKKVIDALASGRRMFFHISSGETTIYCPKLKEPHGEGKPSTFILSGTTFNNPELQENPNIEVIDCSFPVNSSRLTIHVQHGDEISFSKTAAGTAKNYAGTLAWTDYILNSSRSDHELALVMTYKAVSGKMYKDLKISHDDWLVPYSPRDGSSTQQLAYFGGTNGSNAYNDCTLFIVAGLNRYRPADYLNRAIAIANVSPRWASMKERSGGDKAQVWISAMEAELLANDIIQAMYRTDLRNHSSMKKIDVWLLQPPEVTLEMLHDQFPHASFEVIPKLPDAVTSAALEYQKYGGKQTHGAAIEQYLRERLAKDSLTPVTPEEIQAGTSLSREEYNTARKSPQLQKFMDEHFVMTGRGRHCKYAPRGATSSEAAS